MLSLVLPRNMQHVLHLVFEVSTWPKMVRSAAEGCHTGTW